MMKIRKINRSAISGAEYGVPAQAQGSLLFHSFPLAVVVLMRTCVTISDARKVSFFMAIIIGLRQSSCK